MAEKITVYPGVGRKVPLPVPGIGPVGAEGRLVAQTSAVRRLLATKDLITEKPAADATAPTKKG